jgi:hypothetical protein
VHGRTLLEPERGKKQDWSPAYGYPERIDVIPKRQKRIGQLGTIMLVSYLRLKQTSSQNQVSTRGLRTTDFQAISTWRHSRRFIQNLSPPNRSLPRRNQNTCLLLRLALALVGSPQMPCNERYEMRSIVKITISHASDGREGNPGVLSNCEHPTVWKTHEQTNEKSFSQEMLSNV